MLFHAFPDRTARGMLGEPRDRCGRQGGGGGAYFNHQGGVFVTGGAFRPPLSTNTYYNGGRGKRESVSPCVSRKINLEIWRA